jgi:hypothetical protein
MDNNKLKECKTIKEVKSLKPWTNLNLNKDYTDNENNKLQSII